MTIQISVVIWTILCFLLLMLILHFLLFQPVLKMLDQRRERIQNAAAKKAAYEKLEQEYAAMLEEKRTAFLEQQRKQKKAELESIRSEGKERLEAANDERLHKVDQYRAKAEAECTELLTVLSQRADELAVSFAESLVKE